MDLNYINSSSFIGIFICCFNVLFDENDTQYYSTVESAFNNIKEILREMHYDGLITKDEVSKMIVPMSSATKNEFEYTIKKVESKGLKLINKSLQVVNYIQLACQDKTFNSQDDEISFSII